jgi:hypothetical protein
MTAVRKAAWPTIRSTRTFRHGGGRRVVVVTAVTAGETRGGGERRRPAIGL